MRYIGKLFGCILLALNVVVAILMVISAYSPNVNPLAHPVWSCAGLFFPIFLFGNYVCSSLLHITYIIHRLFSVPNSCLKCSFLCTSLGERS
jgi:hypothetical protein